MSLKLDHIVIAVHDLERTIADYGALGFHVVRGGDHPGRATHNALVVFAHRALVAAAATPWRRYRRFRAAAAQHRHHRGRCEGTRPAARRPA
jgi:catechol 2,3-dioxygenase-like lactoylglutathione lyase family enzyme